MQSAPWYTSIQVYGIFTIVVLVVVVIVKFLIKKFREKNIK